MKRKNKYLIRGLIVMLVATYLIVNYQRILIDGISGEIGTLMWPDTRYSEEYTHKGFNQVKIGMSEHEVIDILGEPLLRWTPYDKKGPLEKRSYVSFVYSESPSSTHYRLRQIELDENRKVVKKTAYFYVD